MAYTWTETPTLSNSTTYNNYSTASAQMPVFFRWNPQTGEIFWDRTSCDPCAHPYYVPMGTTPYADDNGNIFV